MRLPAYRFLFAALAVFTALLLASGNAIAQGGRSTRPKSDKADSSGDDPARESGKFLRIRKLDWRGTAGILRLPDYQVGNVSKAPIKSGQEWSVITVSYDTAPAPEWLDQITVHYHVLLLNEKNEGKKDLTPYTLLEGTVTYVDVKGGPNHISTMYIRPNTTARFGEVVAVGIEMVTGDETIAKSEFSGSAKLTKEVKDGGSWWSTLRESDKVAVRDGYLLNRSQTPYVLVNYYEEEAIR